MNTKSKLPATSIVITLSHQEIFFLMQELNVSTVMGIQTAGKGAVLAKSDDFATARNSLLEKGLLILPQNGIHDRIHPMLFDFLTPLFFADTVLMVMRTLNRNARQLLYFSRKGSALVLHSLPDAQSHRLERFKSPDQAVELLHSWFPLKTPPPANVRFHLSLEEFELFRSQAETGKQKAALKLLKNQLATDEEKLSLISGVQTQNISGSFALLKLHENEVKEISSSTFFAGEESIWLIENAKEGPKESLDIRPLDILFSDAITGWVEKWVGLPQRAKTRVAPGTKQKPAPPEKL